MAGGVPAGRALGQLGRRARCVAAVPGQQAPLARSVVQRDVHVICVARVLAAVPLGCVPGRQVDRGDGAAFESGGLRIDGAVTAARAGYGERLPDQYLGGRERLRVEGRVRRNLRTGW